MERLMEKLLLVVLCMATANAQQNCSMPDCGSEPAVPDDCCRGGFPQIGLVENAEQCGPCPRVFGFSTKELVVPERGEAYIVNVGVLSGSFDEKIELDILIHLDTASLDDVILHNPHVVISPQQSIVPVRFTLPIDKIAQEENETFSFSLSGFDNSIAGQNATLIETVNITVIDSDVVAFGFSEADFSGREGENSTIPVRIVKQHKVRLANDVTLRVTPLTVEMALQNGTISYFHDEDPLSPSRADENDFDGRELIVTFPADEDEAIDELQVDIYIADDDVEENYKQYFIVYLEATNAINLDHLVISEKNHATCIILDNDEECRIGFAQTEYTIAEPDVPTSFNVTLIKEDGCMSEKTFSVDISISAPFTDTSAAMIETNAGESYDYSPELPFSNVTFPPHQESISLNFTVNSDNLPERLEAFQLTCAPARGSPTFKLPVIQSTEIRITDNDFAVVGFERTLYAINEARGLQEVCVQVFNPPRKEELIFDIPLVYQTITKSADEEDFTTVNVAFTFSAGIGSPNLERRKCFRISITNDELHEATESFSIMLRLQETSRVNLQPSITEVSILNDDDAVVGFEHSLYNVSESIGSLEVCVLVSNPPSNKALGILNINLQLDFGRNADKRDFALPRRTLHFTNATRRSCVAVQITDDDLHEETESFLLRLSGDSGVSFHPVATEIAILDNDDEQTLSTTPSIDTETPTSTAGGSPTLFVIVGVIIGGLVLLVIMVVICICCYFRNKKSRKVNTSYDENQGGVQIIKVKPFLC